MKTKIIQVPDEDFDLMLNFPSGKMIIIQSRPSNADINYNGSLDIILPADICVTNWIGDDMEASPAVSEDRQHERIAKQLVIELP